MPPKVGDAAEQSNSQGPAAARDRKPSLKSVPKDGGGGYSQDIHRSLPNSRDAERAVLSCMLQSPTDVIGEAIEKLTPDHFYVPAHGTIYTVLIELYDQGQAIDLITLNNRLIDRKLMEQVGGAGAVAELLDIVPTAALFDYYVGILRDKFILRHVIQTCTESVTLAYENQEDVGTLLDSVETRILKIRDATGKQEGIREMRHHVLHVIESIEDMYDNDQGGMTGLSTGFKDLDEKTNGLHGGEMIVVAARPSMGKTSFVMNLVENVAIDSEHPKAAAVFSLEMSAEQLVQRLLCSRAEVEMQKLRGGFLSQQRDFPRLREAAEVLINAPIYIDDTPGLTIMELRAKARRLKKSYDIQLIAIDYLQLLKAPSHFKQDNRQQEIAEISGGIKALSKELNIPIIVLAQLNRNPDARGGTPRISDLRESGAIEQDADVVGLLFRDEYYADEDDKEEVEGRATLDIAKQRNGPTGAVPLTFIKKWMRFVDRAHDDDPYS